MFKKGNINDILKFWFMIVKIIKMIGIILSSFWGLRYVLWMVNIFNIIYYNDRDLYKF